ncbi:short chain dehydrogenase [Rossellomorea vietnamensis]|uniref:short chain dehydrogenase n=1 Tax=Rossellomorea vietnamensis TaxID=218284 RepID=UPI001E5FE5B4|nr:short chain dehydrogenase [Rossellomorea vietnamensis]MCC5801723.1 short chain dehydrogenase [Rossellomorea vietnamensis]
MKIAVIGATGTIGTEVANKLQSMGHDVVRVGSKSGDYQLDITSLEQIKRFYEDNPALDAVVSAAGGASFKKLENLEPEDNQIAINSKLLGQINLVLIGQHYLNENGSFTLTSGVMMDDPIEFGSSAAMANGGIASFVKSASIELKNNLRINNVSPNVITESMDKYGDFFKGFTSVSLSKVANAYIKSVEGKQTGETYKVYD